jgi:glyoxylase-like metal-dependent hydrolase (beta-lactamase superfamily II)
MSATWSDPVCEKVAGGVHRIPLNLPDNALRAVNVYAVEGEHGLALVDGGMRTSTALAELDDALSAIGRSHRDIRDVYVTHLHSDHYTMAVELRRLAGARVHIGAPEGPGIDTVASIGSNVAVDYLGHVERGGAPAIAHEVRDQMAGEDFFAGDWERPDSLLGDGPVGIGGLQAQAVSTPGHTRGHMVYQASGDDVTFTGDHVLPTITPSIGFEPGEWDAPLQDFLDSLELMLELPDTRMLPAHGWVAESVHERCRDLLGHHEERFGQVIAALEGAGSRTALGVARRLPWTRRDSRFDELDAFNQMIAVCETLAHLDVLVDRGMIATDRIASGQGFYRAA